MLFFRILIILITFLNLSCFAKDRGIEQLILWKPHEDVPVQILPLRTGETKHEAVDRYLYTLLAHPELESLFQGTKFNFHEVNLDNIKILNLEKLKKSRNPQFLLIANYLNDLAPNHFRPRTLIKPFEFFGADVYMLAPLAEIGLSKKDAKIFRNILAKNFDAAVSLGGDDIHPNLYGEEVTFSNVNQLNIARDKSELRIIKDYNKQKNGVFYGICRGSQLCAVSKGNKLIQDLEYEQGAKQQHWSEIHPIEILNGKDNLLSKFLEKAEFDALSAHHQAVKLENKRLIPVAFFGHGKEYVIEAWQFPNKLGLGVQFHPELYEQNDDNRKLLKAMVNYAKKIKQLKLENSDSCVAMLVDLLF